MAPKRGHSPTILRGSDPENGESMHAVGKVCYHLLPEESKEDCALSKEGLQLECHRHRALPKL